MTDEELTKSIIDARKKYQEAIDYAMSHGLSVEVLHDGKPINGRVQVKVWRQYA